MKLIFVLKDLNLSETNVPNEAVEKKIFRLIFWLCYRLQAQWSITSPNKILWRKFYM